MNLAGLFDPVFMLVDEEIPAAFALRHHDLGEFRVRALEVIEANGIDSRDYDVEPEELIVHTGTFYLGGDAGARGYDWWVVPASASGDVDPVPGTFPFPGTEARFPE